MLTDVSHISRSEPILATLQHPVIVVRIEEVRGSIPRSSTTSKARIRTAESGPYAAGTKRAPLRHHRRRPGPEGCGRRRRFAGCRGLAWSTPVRAPSPVAPCSAVPIVDQPGRRWVPPNMVQRVMGHERASTTLDLYTRRTDDADRPSGPGRCRLMPQRCPSGACSGKARIQLFESGHLTWWSCGNRTPDLFDANDNQGWRVAKIGSDWIYDSHQSTSNQANTHTFVGILWLLFMRQHGSCTRRHGSGRSGLRCKGAESAQRGGCVTQAAQWSGEPPGGVGRDG